MLDARSLGMLSAALRHVRTAEHLASVPPPDRSPDQAFHLAGFAPECARKATLPRPTYDQAIGHGVAAASEAALRVALAMDPVGRRYDIEGWRARYPALARWNERVRYEPTGRRTEQEVADLLREVREIVDRLTFALWADGKIPAGFAW
jgi:hypothetical protein